MRPATTGLATAFFRFYLLDTLGSGPARPASLLAQVAAEKAEGDKFPFKFDYTAPSAADKAKMLADEARANCEDPNAALNINKIAGVVNVFSKARGNGHGLPVKSQPASGKPTSAIQPNWHSCWSLGFQLISTSFICRRLRLKIRFGQSSWLSRVGTGPSGVPWLALKAVAVLRAE